MPGNDPNLGLASVIPVRRTKLAAAARKPIGFKRPNLKMLTDPDLAPAQVTDAVTLSRCRTQTTISTVHLDTDWLGKSCAQEDCPAREMFPVRRKFTTSSRSG